MSESNVRISLRQRRIFSDKLKKKIVKDIANGKVSVTAVSREYQVSIASIRPHWSLVGQMPPQRFEEYVNKLSKGKEPKMIIYKSDEL